MGSVHAEGASGFGGRALRHTRSFLGFDAVTALPEETIDPRRTVPRAIMLVALIGGGTIVTVSFVTQLVHPASVFEDSASMASSITPQIGGQLFGWSHPSSASGSALSSTVPDGSLTGSVPMATATRKWALRSETRRPPASMRQVPPSCAVNTPFSHSWRRNSRAPLVRFRPECRSCCWSSIAWVPQPAGCGSHG
ncbi:hypothetical protein [Pseudarthrobacter sp. AB1]|uniref:hypothetical protein n=1 Tax=Pseudarthrobacter sp. AB1 TaxID=2138309 RepID=UPI00272EE444|nr:hypothetical protein [Pseudarthrobacter sp. AB1]